MFQLRWYKRTSKASTKIDMGVYGVYLIVAYLRDYKANPY